MRQTLPGIFLFIVVFFINNAPTNGQDLFEITVAKDGSGNFTSVQQAIDACKSFPDKRITIHIKNGIYNEKVVIPAFNNCITLVGEDADKTIITWGDYFGKINRGRNSTFYTYTMLVEADDFHAENLTIENSAGAVGQAVALHVTGDRCSFSNCRILGNQDTLYTGGLNSHQYYKKCHIEGTTDFIFGAATAVFDSCTVYSKASSFITASSTPQGREFGYVFLNCSIKGGDGIQKVFLGRPWRDYAKVVFIKCNMGPHIVPAGWSNWSGTTRDKTAYFAEYKNTGPGSEISGRVSWSHQLSDKEALKYTIGNIFPLLRSSYNSSYNWITGKD